MAKRTPSLRPFADALTSAMVEYYTQSQKRFTSDQQAHYIYSPRELTRWKYAINEAWDTLVSLEDLVRLWAHEALRLFEDRLLTDEEKKWCQTKVDELAYRFFPTVNQSCLARPIIYSTYLTKSYQSCKLDDLREYVLQKLKVFNEEEYDVQLVIFDEVLEHISKIDRVLRQPIGHMLLVGASGVGKTTLSRFVSWINGLKVFQIKAGRNYSLQNFDEDLRAVMKRSGCRLEKICFIFDESNVLSVAFLERMNALLASGEVPGLFEGEEYHSLINTYKEAQGNKGRETEEEIYQQFTKNVQRNLHVVFTMNPANPDFSNRTASSPAIFNRCVIDWFGDWPEEALLRVAKELTASVELEKGVEHAVIVDLIARIHKSVKILNDKLRAAAKKFNFLTPRDYLDFIRHFIALTKEKRALLQEQEGHLQKGLKSIRSTEATVTELKKALDIKNKDNEESKRQAEANLVIIMEEQKKCNVSIAEAKVLEEKIAQKRIEINERQSSVQRDLDAVEPQRLAALAAVQSIQKKDLDEVRRYAVPPARIVSTLEVFFKFIKGRKLSWEEIKAEMAKPTFIGDILNFSTDKVAGKIRDAVQAETDTWEISQITNASRAAGPLAMWLKAQIDFSHIKDRVKPMEDEVAQLGRENAEKEIEMQKTQEKIKEMEKKIEELKVGYGELVNKNQKLEMEMKVIGAQIGKSEALMMSLNVEKNRWEASSKEFVHHFQTLIGDVLLSAAFLTYLGFFDQFYREVLLRNWKNYMTTAKLQFKKDISILEYLSSPSERIIWQSKGLPADDLCVQNAIILKRFNRYPLIIDPAGQAIDFMINLYSESERKLIRTSFIDDGFMKQLEMSLRFGLPILIQDVEKIEPILNSVLNKEVMKQGGRVVIRVGDQIIDFNSDFRLFMITRNSEARFTPDLCSRVTFVNFTVTKSSLENQFVNIYLRNERPDVEEKRINLLKLQGEFIVKLRELEDQLLNELSKSEGGNILENEEMIQTLENLKKQATKIQSEKEQSDVVLEEINQVIEKYKPVSVVSSRLYFVLLSLASIKPMYQFSLKFYMKVLLRLLEKNERLAVVARDRPEERLKVIENELFLRIYEKVNNSIHESDKLLVATRFAQIKLDTLYGKPLSEFFSLVLKPTVLIETTLGADFLKGSLTKQQLTKLEDLSQRPGFEALIDSCKRKADQWIKIIRDPSVNDMSSVKPFLNPSELKIDFEEGSPQSKIADAIADLLMFNIIKPQRSLSKLTELIELVLGKEFLTLWNFDLRKVIEDDADNKSPILFASAPGFDPSSRVFELARSINKHYEDTAIGSEEGFTKASRDFAHGIKSGNWVIFRNVHLAVGWLREIEQELYKSVPHRDFRLFLMMEFSDKIPATLLRQSVKFIFELPDGVKASVRRTYATLFSSAKSDRAPAERARLHFLLAWIHGVIMERLRYTPTGWSKKYEFSEADLKCAVDVVDEFVDALGNRQNIALDLIPFEALRSVIAENIYGGKIDNEYDLKILKSVVDQYLTPDSFDPKKPLVKDKETTVYNPEATRFSEFKNWVDTLEAPETPVWAGLPAQANDLLKIDRIETLMTQVTSIQDGNEEEIGIEEDAKGQAAAPTKIGWFTELGERTSVFLDILPTSLAKPDRNETLIANPLFRFLEREATLGSNLLDTVRRVMKNVVDMVEGRTLPQQETKKIAQNIYVNEIPKFWRKYTVPDTLLLTQWIKDFKNRTEQLAQLQTQNNWQCKGVNLGEFLFPEAFLTASRQFVAQSNKVSMDELQLSISITEEKEVDLNSFLVKNIWIEGVKWSNKGFEITDDMVNHLKNVKFSWVKCKASEIKVAKPGEIFVPLYLNSSRKNLITSIKVPIVNPEVTEKQLYQRGLALIAWRI